MRILFLNSSGHLGGAEISLLDMLASLRLAVPEWPLRLILGENGPLVARARDLGVETSVLTLPRSFARLGDAGVGGPAGHQIGPAGLLRRVLAAGLPVAGYCRQLRRIIRQAAPELIHSNGLKMHIVGMWARPFDTPFIWHIHDYVGQRPLSVRFLRFYAKQCSAAVANSRSTALDTTSTCGPDLKVYRVYNGVDLERFSPHGPKVNLDELAGLPPAAPGTLRIGIVATLALWKGHEVFLRALSRLPESLPLRGYIIGDAVYQTDGSQHKMGDLRAMAARLALGDRVGFTGFLMDSAAAMRTLDIVVHASTQPEPFGLVIAEGMACGRAVIASEAGGAAEIIALGNGVMGHPPGDIAALAKCIERLALNPDLRASMGQEARGTAERFFNRERLASELIPIYREAAEGHDFAAGRMSAKCNA
jgi:glycosyltransferase involved in cell wall biosynthesis